jgi:hypothetical protein
MVAWRRPSLEALDFFLLVELTFAAPPAKTASVVETRDVTGGPTNSAIQTRDCLDVIQFSILSVTCSDRGPVPQEVWPGFP